MKVGLSHVFSIGGHNGVEMTGADDLGRLAPGSKADITVVDLSTLRTGPINDPIRAMVMNANGAQVVPGVDVEALRRWSFVSAPREEADD